MWKTWRCKKLRVYSIFLLKIRCLYYIISETGGLSYISWAQKGGLFCSSPTRTPFLCEYPPREPWPLFLRGYGVAANPQSRTGYVKLFFGFKEADLKLDVTMWSVGLRNQSILLLHNGGHSCKILWKILFMECSSIRESKQFYMGINQNDIH